jgi:hypothetical protein
MNKAKAAEARLRTLAKTYSVVSQSVSAIQVACLPAVTPYGSEHWWDAREVGRRDDLQLLLNRQSRSILSALPMTQWGAQMRESGLALAPVTSDSRKQRFTARLENACSSKLKQLHSHHSSGTPICRVVRKQH